MSRQRSSVPEASKAPKPFLTVYSLDRDHSQHSLSIYVTKLQLRLRHGGIRYENGLGTRGDAPKKKFPYVRFEESGELMGDSALITERLVREGRLEDLNGRLTAEEKARDYCLRVMIEDRLYYLVNYERWFMNYPLMRDTGPFGHLPWGLRHVAGFVGLQYVRMMLFFQGTGRHTPDEVRHFTDEAVDAIAGFAEAARDKAGGAGNKEAPFWILGGEKPTEADFTLFGALSGYLVNPIQPATTARVKESPALIDYVQRIHRAYFPDYRGFP